MSDPERERNQQGFRINTDRMSDDLGVMIDLLEQQKVYDLVRTYFPSDWNKLSDIEYDVIENLHFAAVFELKPSLREGKFRSGKITLGAYLYLNQRFFKGDVTDSVLELQTQLGDMVPYMEPERTITFKSKSNLEVAGNLLLTRKDGLLIIVVRQLYESKYGQGPSVGVSKSYYTEGEAQTTKTFHIEDAYSLEGIENSSKGVDVTINGVLYSGLVNGSMRDTVRSFTREVEEVIGAFYKLSGKQPIPREIILNKGWLATVDMAVGQGSFEGLKFRPTVLCGHCNNILYSPAEEHIVEYAAMPFAEFLANIDPSLDWASKRALIARVQYIQQVKFLVEEGKVVVSAPPCPQCGSHDTTLDWQQSHTKDERDSHI